jgi:LuxR family maltose regulon positive regulatory protein
MELEGFSLKRAEIIGCILLARVKLALGEMGETHELLDRAWNTIQKYNLKQITIPAPAYRARMLLQMGNLEMAAQWAATVELPNEGSLNPALEYDYITLVRVFIAHGRLEEARQLLARLRLSAEQAGRLGRLVEILALQAVVTSAQQDENEARDILAYALALAEPEGFVRSFVDEGELMRRLLFDYQSRMKKHSGNQFNPLAAYVARLLDAFSQPFGSEKARRASMPEPLSERELDILRLIATGRSNKEIAEILVIAISTVKSHINNLYGKLGTNRRTEAIAIARELGLISE